MLHGKNLQPLTGDVFVNSLQVLDSPQENPCTYGESVSVTFNLRYPGQYYDKESGLSYNYFRSYQPNQGRYTQADPIGLDGGWNKFAYVEGNPLMYSDPLGLQPYTNQTPPAGIPGGPWTPAGGGQQPGTFYGPQNANGPRDICRYVPDEANRGPNGAKDPYWKTKEPGKPWTRFNLNGNPITPNQAHPGAPRTPIAPITIPGSIPLYPLFCPLCPVMFPPSNGPS